MIVPADDMPFGNPSTKCNTHTRILWKKAILGTEVNCSSSENKTRFNCP